MNAKNLLVTFVLALFLMTGFAAAAAPAFDGDLVDSAKVYVDGMNVAENDNISVIAGDEITVKVYFTAENDDNDVTVNAELKVKGEKVRFDAITNVFDVEAGRTYKKVLTLKVPAELKDEVSNTLELTIEIEGNDYESELEDYNLVVQRPSYNAVVKSLTTPSSITAGETFPLEIVLKNMGYNDLDDVYVTAKIADLSVSQGPKWFGDIVTLDRCDACNDDEDEDTVFGKLNLKVPYTAKAGVYALEVTVANEDTITTVAKQIVIANDFANNVVSTSAAKAVAEGEEAVYDLLIVNPTNNVKVYKIVADSEDVTSTVSQTVVAVPAGSSKTVKVAASAVAEGNYAFDVNVFSGENLDSTVTYNLQVEGKKTNTVFVLTIVLAIVFLVLLVALIVLLGRRPEKSEEFGESYY